MVSSENRLRRWLIVSLVANGVLVALGFVALVYKLGLFSERDKAQGDQVRFSETRLYRSLVSTARAMPPHPGAVVFIGDSMIDYAPLTELFGPDALNRGIAGDRLEEIARRIDEIGRHRPATVVLWAGINDLAAGRNCAQTSAAIAALARSLSSGPDASRVIVVPPAPVRPEESRHPAGINDQIRCTCTLLSKELKGTSVVVVDPAQVLADPSGQLRAEYTYDGVHLNGQGYLAWGRLISPLLGQPKAPEG
ncbi:MAG TPA: GDSL-type esterase/lipase family protein [Rhodocyclaceae bacterium]|nr:GDSL-type esterase/lipase family protein [Rhodocyclaceae bacterium]HNL22657.1 GDSL-type esterase/lipase family protein [Rhodocyclaceae bacterium]HNM21935.1 GDSL-type esterase/lipase family protein [Rhodocyclaceae bacterium]HNM80397.1 GDSL-type esterase/lipase family protein [Rhodocyclaceae bacterium]HNP03924.1 GDSL-type esterase/lipase family protein [Rhodocyclaceae bacterium]